MNAVNVTNSLCVIDANVRGNDTLPLERMNGVAHHCRLCERERGKERRKEERKRKRKREREREREEGREERARKRKSEGKCEDGKDGSDETARMRGCAYEATRYRSRKLDSTVDDI